MSSDIAISVCNLSKSYQIYEKPMDRLKQGIFRGKKQYYKEFKALDNISFEVKKGETVGVVGRNGSGKSTLLQMICGTLSPTAGSIELKGRVAALLELGAGFNPEFTGRENVYMNASILGLTKQEIDEKYNKISSFADIGEFIDQPVKTYSSGMYVRLAFSVIAHVDADILVIDEALSVGDAFFVQKCMRFLRSFMQDGTVIFVSHDTGAVLNLCDSAILIQNGIITERGAPKEVTERYLEELYEVEQGGHAKTNNDSEVHVESEKVVRDMRLDFVNTTNLRNDIELFEFNADSSDFGKGGAIITAVHFLDKKGNLLSYVVGGEVVVIKVQCAAKESLINPIIGFQVKDHLGQVIFAENTFITTIENPVSVIEGDKFVALFEFVMPVMPLGDYAVSAAVADGTQESHVQHQWFHDALVFKVHSTSICHGLIGVPLLSIELKRL